MGSLTSGEKSPPTHSEPNTHNKAESDAEVPDTARVKRRRRLLGQLLGVLGAACALTWGCTDSQVTTTRWVSELAAPGGASIRDLLGSPALSAPAAHSVAELGRSVNGVPLIMEVFGNGPDRVLVVGGIHGSEPAGAKVASELARLLRSGSELLGGRTVAILAEANPDGLRSGQRTNANGVDLNRNFPSADWRRADVGETSHGPSAASEPETLAVMKAVQIVKPGRIIDIHSIKRGRHGNNYDGPAEQLAELMSYFNGYPVLADVGYATPGALGKWTGVDHAIPTITLELPRELSTVECWRDNREALDAFIDADPDSLGR